MARVVKMSGGKALVKSLAREGKELRMPRRLAALTSDGSGPDR